MIKVSDYNSYVIIGGKIYPYYPKYHEKQLKNGEVYTFSECIEMLKGRR